MKWLTPVLPLLLVPFVASACSSADNKDEPTEQPSSSSSSSSAALTERAKTALRTLGQQGPTYTSSLDKVTSWTVYRNTGITVIGKNSEGKIEVGVTWQTEATTKNALVACATARNVACGDAMRAISHDLKSSVPSKTASIRPLDVSGPDADPCEAALVNLAGQNPLLGEIDRVSCIEGSDTLRVDENNPNAWTGPGMDPCFISNSNGEYASIAGLANACCGGADDYWQDIGPSDDRQLLTGKKVDLLCQKAGEALTSSLKP